MHVQYEAVLVTWTVNHLSRFSCESHSFDSLPFFVRVLLSCSKHNRSDCVFFTSKDFYFFLCAGFWILSANRWDFLHRNNQIVYSAFFQYSVLNNLSSAYSVPKVDVFSLTRFLRYIHEQQQQLLWTSTIFSSHIWSLTQVWRKTHTFTGLIACGTILVRLEWPARFFFPLLFYELLKKI